MEGRPITSLDQYNGFDTRTEKRRIKTNPNDRYFETYTSKKSKRTKKSKTDAAGSKKTNAGKRHWHKIPAGVEITTGTKQTGT